MSCWHCFNIQHPAGCSECSCWCYVLFVVVFETVMSHISIQQHLICCLVWVSALHNILHQPLGCAGTHCLTERSTCITLICAARFVVISCRLLLDPSGCFCGKQQAVVTIGHAFELTML